MVYLLLRSGAVSARPFTGGQTYGGSLYSLRRGLGIIALGLWHNHATTVWKRLCRPSEEADARALAVAQGLEALLTQASRGMFACVNRA
ncbi:hypothetical protein D3879_14170 [Pseudomonas cavernicola]|uniref:Uncharacterized protein n=1 Tax=Pseudomonas cavernicola TaxID=2320866 RepID=A0A418XPB8_9PSED|nr:hypothetical protein D3879_14105 [Pseudomonas cavernicola]RJG14292.1 hypothetical protein D3879_14170 [Pseudomonas cavernicola]